MGSYFRPSSLSDALAALAARPPLVPLAGGTDFYPSRVVQTPDEAVLDIAALPGLRRIEARADHWWIPCLATWTDIIETALPSVFDGLKQAARQVGGVQIQNAGTLAGNVCNASPAADGIPCLLALEASVELASVAGNRVLPLADFLLGPRKTARRPDELVLGLRIPRSDETARSVFLKLGARRYLVISIAMVAAVITRAADGRIARVRVAAGACSATAQRLPALEDALIGTFGDTVGIVGEHLAPLSPIGDIRATAAYRRQAVGTLLRRAVAA
ncbi:xanthine dehydrogenase family protein subunit M [Acidisphaera sp. S103]|uniref:FAD binding domain-containing protein n=1 Tax=Acidisphaera sp. S103 TaxID=1747223 RepID=UPI00131B05CD|nr:FAD binding domain-containing protein [Acidisphaera sp. S103]